MAGSRERQRQRARERHERQREERRQRQSQLRKRLSIGAVVVLVLGLVAGLSLVFVGGSTPAAKSKPKATASASATSSAAAVAEPAHHCTYTNNGSGKPSLPTATPDYNASYTATINTNLGKIGISLLNSKATCTVNSFAHLAETNFFNNTQCWRVDNGTGGIYMLQCGDPTATAKSKLSCSSSTLGTGGPGYQFADENLTGRHIPRGPSPWPMVARTQTAASSSLCSRTQPCPLATRRSGKLPSGLDILQNVAKAGTSCTIQAGGGVPKEKVIINSVTVKKS